MIYDEIIDFVDCIYLKSEHLNHNETNRQITLKLKDNDDDVVLMIDKTRMSSGKTHYFVKLTFEKED